MPDIKSDPRGVLEVAQSLVKAGQNISRINEQMAQQLKALGASNQDETYGVISQYVASVRKAIEVAQPDLRKVANGLMEYAQKLIDSNRALR